MIEFSDDVGVVGTVEYANGELIASRSTQSVVTLWLQHGNNPADFENAYDGWSNGNVTARRTDDLNIMTANSAGHAFHLPGKHEQKKHGNRFNKPGDKSSGLRARNTDPTTGDKPPTAHRAPPHDADVPWTKDNIAGLETYVSMTGFYLINSTLRQTDDAIKYAEKHPDDVEVAKRDTERIRDAMRPLPNDTTVYRGVKLSQFPGLTELDELPSLTGKTVHDKAFVSTSTELSGKFLGSGADVNDHILMKINVPAGYPVADLEKMSNKKWGENEMLLDDGTTFKVRDAGIVELAPGVFRWQVSLDVAP